MDRLEAMRLFTRVVDRRSFTEAAHDLDIPRSTATQVIRQLENRLGVRLLQRTTRTVMPTLDGEAYYRRCLAILETSRTPKARSAALSRKACCGSRCRARSRGTS